MPTIVTGPFSTLRMDLLDLDFDGVIEATATHIRVTYEPGWYNDFYGTFVYDIDGNVVGGTLTGISYTVGGDLVYQLTDFSIDGETFLAFVDAGDYEGLKALILAGNDTITGANGDDFLEGFAGDDILTGNGGADTMIGGAGNDSYYIDAGGDVVLEEAGEGTDTIFAATNLVLGAGFNVENAVLGGTGDFSLQGNELSNHLQGNSGANLIDGWEGDDVVSGGGGDDTLLGWTGNDVIDGGDGADWIFGEGGIDTLTGGAGADNFVAETIGLNGDTITDFTIGDRIILRGENFATFSFSFSGSTLTYPGGSITLLGAEGAQFTASAASASDGGGVQLIMTSAPPLPPPPLPPPLPDSMSRLLLTESGQDFDIGGNVTIIGTASDGEEVRVVGGNILLDASFNRGGDTVVLPGAAGSYSATLSGSFVTLSNGVVTISIPVGVNGLTVEFDDAERSLRVDTGSGQVMLGGQAIGSVTEWVEASTTPFVGNGPDTGPASMARLILTETGQDVDIGGNVVIFGTAGAGEVIIVHGGTVRLDASFNQGGDTVILPGDAADYTATLSGSFVTIAGGGTSVAIPVGVAGLAVQFGDATEMLRIDTASGQVKLGNQVVTSSGSLASAQPGPDKDASTLHGPSLDDFAGLAGVAFTQEQAWARVTDYAPAGELQRYECNETFSLG